MLLLIMNCVLIPNLFVLQKLDLIFTILCLKITFRSKSLTEKYCVSCQKCFLTFPMSANTEKLYKYQYSKCPFFIIKQNMNQLNLLLLSEHVPNKLQKVKTPQKNVLFHLSNFHLIFPQFGLSKNSLFVRILAKNLKDASLILKEKCL